MSIKRNYKGKDAEMLIAASSICSAAISHQTFLATKRANWADPFFTNFETEINTAVSTYLGVDNALALRTQTAALNNIMGPAYSNLGDVRIQLVEDYKSNKPRLNELLTTLGYNTHWKSAQAKDQEALIQLLYQFKTNLTTTIRTEIVAKGIADATLTQILDAADDLMAANVSQETIKQSRKAVTDAGITEFNKIYDKAISIARISRRFFKDSTAIQDQFSYAKILKNLQGGALTTLYNQEVQISPDTPFIIDTVRITTKSVITLFTVSNLVYVCRNETGCYGSGIDTYHLTPEVEATLTKADLVGDGKYLVLSSLSLGFATVMVKIQG